MEKDRKSDDKFITSEYQDLNEQEPPASPIDRLASTQKRHYRIVSPKIMIIGEPGPPHIGMHLKMTERKASPKRVSVAMKP